ncbi:MAG: hypothetical protein Q9227_006429 [Pyrenula ochraceoflavens]
MQDGESQQDRPGLSRFSSQRRGPTLRHQRSRSEDLSCLAHGSDICDCGQAHKRCSITYDLRRDFKAGNSSTKARHPYGSATSSHLIEDIQDFSRFAEIKHLPPPSETQPLAVNPSAEHTQEALRRVQKFSTKKTSSVDIERLVSWHRQHDPGTEHQDDKPKEHPARSGGSQFGDYGSLEATPEEDESRISTEGSVDSKMSEGMRTSDGAVHYGGVVDLPPDPTTISHSNWKPLGDEKRKKEKRPSRDFVDSFPTWFLHHDKIQTPGTSLSLSANNDGDSSSEARLGNVGGNVAPPVSHIPVPKHLAPPTLSQTNQTGPLSSRNHPNSSHAAVTYCPVDKAVLGVQPIAAYSSPYDVLQPSPAPRRGGKKDQYDTQGPNMTVLERTSSGSASSQDQKFRNRYISHAKVAGSQQLPEVTNKTSSPIPERSRASSADHVIPARSSSNASGAEDSKFTTSRNFEDTVVRPLAGATSDDISPANTGVPQTPPEKVTSPQRQEKQLDALGVSKAHFPLPPCPEPRDPVQGLSQENWLGETSTASSLCESDSGGSTTTIDAIEATLPSPKSPGSPLAEETIVTDRRVDREEEQEAFQTPLRHWRAFPTSPLSPPPTAPLPPVPVEETPSKKKRPSKDSSAMRTSLRERGSYDPYRVVRSPNSLTHNVDTILIKSPLQPPVANGIRISTKEISRNRHDDQAPDVDSVASALRNLASSMAEKQRQERDRHGSTHSPPPKPISRSNSLISVKNIGRSRKDIKMRHLTTARARAENDRLERDSQVFDSITEGQSPRSQTSSDTLTLGRKLSLLSSPRSVKTSAEDPYPFASPHQAASTRPQRKESPQRPTSSSANTTITDTTDSRPTSIRRRTSFLGNSGTQELLLCKNTNSLSTPPRTSSCSSTEQGSNGAQSEQTRSLRQEPGQNMRITIPPRHRLRHSQSMGPMTTIYSPSMPAQHYHAGSDESNNAYSYRDSVSSTTSYFHHNQRASILPTNGHHSSSASIISDTAQSSSTSASREAFLQAKVSNLESQLQTHRALTYALLYPQRVLDLASADHVDLDHPLLRHHGVTAAQNVGFGGEFTPPPSAQWRDRVPSVEGQHSTTTTARNSSETPRSSGEHYHGLRRTRSSWAVAPGGEHRSPPRSDSRGRVEEGNGSRKKHSVKGSIEEFLNGGFPERGGFWAGYEGRVGRRMEG